jgi:hypothetical protein
MKEIEAKNGINESIAVLEPLSPAERSRPIGSILIDKECQRLVEKRLDMVRKDKPHIQFNDNAAQDLVRKDFQRAKSTFGKPLRQPLVNNLIVPGLPSDFSLEAAHIKNGRMEFNQ